MTRKTKIVLGFVAALVALLAGWRWLGHSRTEASDPESSSGESGEVIAAVAPVQRGTIENTLTIAGAF
jgi:hypothetical protein